MNNPNNFIYLFLLRVIEVAAHKTHVVTSYCVYKMLMLNSFFGSLHGVTQLQQHECRQFTTRIFSMS